MKEPFVMDDALRALDKARIVEGIKRAALEKIFEENLFDQELLVAESIPAKKGKDARIEYFFNIGEQNLPGMTEGSPVDYKQATIVKHKG